MNQEIYTVYKNLIICLTKYRKLRVTVDGNKNAADLTEPEFLEAINKGYISMVATPTPDANAKRPVVVFLMVPDTEYIKKTPKFKSLMQKFMITRTKDGAIKFHEQDYLIVSKEVINKLIQKEIVNIKKQGKILVERCEYRHFIIEKPLHDAMPEHVIATEDEIIAIEKTMKISRVNLPKIASTDNGAVWCGVRPGQVVKIHRKSETTGTAIGYRVCRP